MLEIEAIETRYGGCRFRSRLEARWAVYFDHIGIKWCYEHEGYDLDDAGYYLPDFWLPEVNMWAEVKPVDLSDGERLKCERLAEGTGNSCLLLVGTPSPIAYQAIDATGDDGAYYILTNNYLPERRFYSTYEGDTAEHFADVAAAVEKARSARFERFGKVQDAGVVA